MKLVFVSSIIILFLASASFSADFCFDEKSIIQLEANLKQCEFDREELAKCEQDRALADEEIKILKQKIELQKQIIELNERELQQYKELLEYQRQSYEMLIKQNKPSTFKQIFNTLGFIGLGLLVGIVL